MAVDQRLVASCDGVFSTIWTAGITNNSLSRVHQGVDIETVNIMTTCEKLRLAVTPMSRNDPVRSNSCEPIQEMQIPFRIISSLYYGTLRIYQQQVNRLFELSKNLMVCSASSLSKVTKRKSSSATAYGATAAKKRRLIATSTQDVFTINSYTELLTEVENLAKWSQSQTLLFDSEPPRSVVNQPTVITCSNKQRTQSRNSSVRELSAEFELFELEDENGFSNGTKEELKEFLSLFADNHVLSLASEALPKEIAYDNGTMLMPTHIPEYRQVNKSEISEISTNMAAIPLTIVNPPARFTNRKRKHCSQFIIDKCIKLSESEMCAQFKHSSKQRAQIKVQLPQKKLPDGHDLLNCYGRSDTVAVHDFKYKSNVLDQESFEREYINVLREIFDTYPFNAEIANLVYSKWNRQTAETARNKRRKRCTAMITMDKLHQHLQYDNNGMDVDTTLLSTQAFADMKPYSNLSPETPRDWSSLGVMMRLLKIWRLEEDKIDAKRFCLSAQNRMNAATAFGSLLLLAAKNFVTVYKIDSSLEMQAISLGAASVQLIQKINQQRRNKVNGR